MLDYTKIGARIRLLRKKDGLSQEALAEKTRLSEKYISRIENGKQKPSTESLITIADSLHQSLYYLLFGEEYLSSSDFFDDLFKDCREEERLFLMDMMIAMRRGLKTLSRR